MYLAERDDHARHMSFKHILRAWCRSTQEYLRLNIHRVRARKFNVRAQTEAKNGGKDNDGGESKAIPMDRDGARCAVCLPRGIVPEQLTDGN